MNTWGNKLKVSIFGESHGTGIGIVIDGIPAGTALDLEEIRREMARRAPGNNPLSTPRKEGDEVTIISGFFEGRTTGTPLAGVIMNTNTRSKDYTPELIRPGHADFTGFVKYGESHDFRGGGHFSGRITAPLVFAGAIAKQILKQKGIVIGSHLFSLAGVSDTPYDMANLNQETLLSAGKKAFPVLDDTVSEAMQKSILSAKENLDSVGGVVECGILGLPAGLGDPFFGSVESRLSSMMFSIPAVKGIEFGTGFGLTEMNGSEANDAFVVQDGRIYTKTNHNGGINGGITNGMPVVFRLAIKPTPSIAQAQETVNLKTMENTTVSIRGRHDPCIAHRAACVVEAAAAIVILDMI